MRAVQYVRMSTEHQQYSTENQSDAILRYASAHGMQVVRTYTDAGKSGLTLQDRDALQKLLGDVESGTADFSAILVYNVSRWGRFQDADESAYYEYLCKRAKVQVHYCAEPFVNDGSLSSTLLKTIKRTMAGEYSRELSVKVFAGKCRLIELGFRQGGQAGYGLRRSLIDRNRNLKALLKPGERKSFLTDRIILVPGPDEEIQIVREIYARYTEQRESADTIADTLNKRGVTWEQGRLWTRSIVFNILTNPKYIGANVFNRNSFKLSKVHVKNPQKMWIRRNNAFTPIVSAELFRKAQATLAERHRHFTDEDLLELLRALWKAAGYITHRLIDETVGMPSRGMYEERFGGILRAYELIGYKPAHNYAFLEGNKELIIRRQDHLAVLISDLTAVGALVRHDPETDLLTINDEFYVSFLLIRCRETKQRGNRWQFKVADCGQDMTIAARMAPGNESILDYYILPRDEEAPKWHDLALDNNFIGDIHRFPDLSFFKDLVRRVALKENL